MKRVLIISLVLSNFLGAFAADISERQSFGRFRKCRDYLEGMSRREVLGLVALGAGGVALGRYLVQEPAARVVYPAMVARENRAVTDRDRMNVLDLFYEYKVVTTPSGNKEDISYVGLDQRYFSKGLAKGDYWVPYFVELRAFGPQLKTIFKVGQVWSASGISIHGVADFPYEAPPWRDKQGTYSKLVLDRTGWVPFPKFQSTTYWVPAPHRQWVWDVEKSAAAWMEITETANALVIRKKPPKGIDLKQVESEILRRFGIRVAMEISKEAGPKPLPDFHVREYLDILRDVCAWGEYLNVPRLDPEKHDFVFPGGDFLIDRNTHKKFAQWGYFWAHILKATPYALNDRRLETEPILGEY